MSTDAMVDKLFARPPPPLEPKAAWDPALATEIASLDEPPLVIAALHLANDDIEGCHLIAQANEGNEIADVLHATLHRREGDYWNSKYWYARLPSAPSHHLPVDRNDARTFVDECEAAVAGRGDEQAAQVRQWRELKDIVSWVRSKHAK